MLTALLTSVALLALPQDIPQSPPPATAAKPAAVTVDAYHEPQQGEGTRLESSIRSAFNAKQSEAGPMEGTWLVTAAGRKLVSLELRNDTTSHQLQGAWRSMTGGAGLNQSGFVSDLFLNGRDLEINCAAGKTHPPTVLELRRDTDGQWRGAMLDPEGHKIAVVMSHAAPGA